VYYSRSQSRGVRELVRDHLADVGTLAGSFADVWGSAAEAQAAGHLHDLGKYGDLFQKVLEHKASHVDHWTAGAYLAAKRYRISGAAMALAIAGHHTGLGRGCLRALQQNLLRANVPQTEDGRHWAGNSTDILEQRWQQDTRFALPESIKSPFAEHAGHPAAAMLDARMLFSALVDADWLSAEAHQNRDESGPVYRQPGPTLRPASDLAALMARIDDIRSRSHASPSLQRVRDNLLALCLEGAVAPQGVFTLAAPTGSGKTLAMLAWALRHCEAHGLRRVIVVLPYLSILDQTLDAIRRALPDREPGYIIEDDSLARDVGGEESAGRLLAENWDAPIIVTTTVRFFESLFSARPSDCRKLHRIAGSAVLFDEAQTLPLPLAAPTLATVVSLAAHYRCSILFSTATQPAFESFSADVDKLAGAVWSPRALAPAQAGLFSLPPRVQVSYAGRVPLNEVARQMSERPAALAIVNLKRHARALYEALRQLDCEGAVHLSTDMCPAHRRDVLEAVRNTLAEGRPCRLAATQCVEAGVDLDFPALWRALAPMDSLCQAAGRCNREGRLHMGEMTVFIPEHSDGDSLYPDNTYERAARLVHEIAALSGFPDLFDPATIRDYYRRFYERSRGMTDKDGKKALALDAAMRESDFPQVDRLYRWIGKRGINILVPYAGRQNLYEDLARQAGAGDVNAAWFRRAREITVGAFVKRDMPALGWLVPVKKGREVIDDWFVLTNSGLYDGRTGLALDRAGGDENFIV
jgi:CRISPR-associated endonuclease/helicase Cas3